MPDDITPQTPKPAPPTFDVVKAPVQENQPPPVAIVDSDKPDIKPPVEQAPKAIKSKSGKPIGVVIAAVIVCTLLVSGVIYLQILKDKESKLVRPYGATIF